MSGETRWHLGGTVTCRVVLGLLIPKPFHEQTSTSSLVLSSLKVTMCCIGVTARPERPAAGPDPLNLVKCALLLPFTPCKEVIFSPPTLKSRPRWHTAGCPGFATAVSVDGGAIHG